MKGIKFILIVLLGTISLNGFSQKDAITSFFGKYMDDEKFTMVYISPKVFEMIATVSEDELKQDKELDEILTNLKGIRILSTKETPLKYYNEVIGTLELNQYELLMQLRDKEENIRFLVKDKGPKVEELLLLVGGKEEFVLMSFIGNIDLKKISKLGKAINIDGAEYLEELEEE